MTCWKCRRREIERIVELMEKHNIKIRSKGGLQQYWLSRSGNIVTIQDVWNLWLSKVGMYEKNGNWEDFVKRMIYNYIMKVVVMLYVREKRIRRNNQKDRFLLDKLQMLVGSIVINLFLMRPRRTGLGWSNKGSDKEKNKNAGLLWKCLRNIELVMIKQKKN